MQAVCGFICAKTHADILRAKKDKESATRERLAHREAKERIKTRAQWLADAQKVFNAYIRERDVGKPCISCGAVNASSYHAGHYLSRGANPEKSFLEDNCHLQCSKCNTHLSGNQINYRINLVKKIGLEAVDALESKHPPLKLTIPEIKELIALYKLKLKIIKSTEP